MYNSMNVKERYHNYIYRKWSSYPVGTEDPSLGVKARPGRDADNSPPFGAEVNNEEELCLLSPQVLSWRVMEQILV
jgi:hypothetical protein